MRGFFGLGFDPPLTATYALDGQTRKRNLAFAPRKNFAFRTRAHTLFAEEKEEKSGDKEGGGAFV